jgi:hypothetical protein
MTIEEFLNSDRYTILDTEVITEGELTVTTVKMTEGKRVWHVRHLAKLGDLMGIKARCVNKNQLPHFIGSKAHEWAENYVAWTIAAA